MWVVGASPAIDVCCDMISRSWFDLIIGMARISGPLCLGEKNHRFLIDVIFILRSLMIGNYNILLHMIQDYRSFFLLSMRIVHNIGYLSCINCDGLVDVIFPSRKQFVNSFFRGKKVGKNMKHEVRIILPNYFGCL